MSRAPYNLRRLVRPVIQDPRKLQTNLLCVYINIPGFRDEAVEKYYAWHQSKVREPAQKQEYQKACDIMIGEYMDLELIYPEFLITGGVKRGPALHIIRDIGKLVGECKRIRTDEQLE